MATMAKILLKQKTVILLKTLNIMNKITAEFYLNFNTLQIFHLPLKQKNHTLPKT